VELTTQIYVGVTQDKMITIELSTFGIRVPILWFQDTEQLSRFIDFLTNCRNEIAKGTTVPKVFTDAFEGIEENKHDG